MGTQKQPRAVGLLTEKKGVVHLPCRMAIGEMRSGEFIAVGLDGGPPGDGDPHAGEDGGALAHHLADRMDVTDIRRAPRGRQSYVDGFRIEPSLKRGVLETLPPLS